MKIALYIVGGLATLFVGSVMVLAALDLAGVVENENSDGSKAGDGDEADPASGDNGDKGDGSKRSSDRPLVRVVRVIDGDTVDTDKLDRVRLIGVDTPEQGRCYDNAATRFTRQRLGNRTVGYELGEEKRDRYGRTLAYLYRGEKMHDLDLVRKGYGRMLIIRPNDKYAGQFRRAARRARRGDEGIYGICERRARRAEARRLLRARKRRRARAEARARRRERERLEREDAPPPEPRRRERERLEREDAPPPEPPSAGGDGGVEDNFNIPGIPGD